MATNLLNINSIIPKTSSFDVSWNGAASLDKRYSHVSSNGAAFRISDSATSASKIGFTGRLISGSYPYALKVTLITSSPHGLSVGDKVWVETYPAPVSFARSAAPSSSLEGFLEGLKTITEVTPSTITFSADGNNFPSYGTAAGVHWPEFSTPSTTPLALSGSIYPASNANGVFYFPGDYTIEGFGSVQSNRWGWLFQISDGVNHFGVLLNAGNNTGVSNVSIYLNSSTATATFSVPHFASHVGDFSHFALVRKGAKVEFLINGFLYWDTTSSAPHGYSSKSFFTIGSFQNYAVPSGNSGVLQLSNFRIVKGQAIYDSASSFSFGSGFGASGSSRILPFSPPPKKPLDPITGTILLTCQDTTLKDNSGNNFNVSCVNRGVNGALSTFTTLSDDTPINQMGVIQRTKLALFPGDQQVILSNPAGSNKNIKINSLRIFSKNAVLSPRSSFYWAIGVIDAALKVNIIASSQFVKSTMNDGSDLAGTKNFIGDVIDGPIYLSEGTTLYGAVASETSFSGTIAYEEIS